MPNQPTIQDSFTARTVSMFWANKQAAIQPFRYSGTTTDGSATEIFVNGISGQRVGVPQESALGVFALHVGHNSTDDEADFHGAVALLENDGGTTALIGSQGTIFTEINDGTGTSSITLAADNTNDALALSVTGTAAKTIYHEVIVFFVCATEPEVVAPSTT